MTPSIGLIVEGHGEVRAAPVLIRRIAAEQLQRALPRLRDPPLRVPKTRLQRPGELERAVELLSIQVGPLGGVLVLLDSDTDCPVKLADELRTRARAARPDRCIEVAVAKFEFEAWLIAGLGEPDLMVDTVDPSRGPPDCESLRDAKGWLRVRRSVGYQPTVDQEPLVRRLKLPLVAARSRSFRALVNCVDRLTAES